MMELSAELSRLQDGFHRLAEDLADRRQGLSVRVFSERDGAFGYCFADPPDVQVFGDDSCVCLPDDLPWVSPCGLERSAGPCADTYPRDKFCLLAQRGGELLLCVRWPTDVDLRAMDAATRWIWFVWYVSDESRPYADAQGCDVRNPRIENIAEASDLAIEWLLQHASQLKPATPKDQPEGDEATTATPADVGAHIHAREAGEQHRDPPKTPTSDAPNRSVGDTELSDDALADLERTTPPFNRDDGSWVRNTLAAELEGVETRTLARYRGGGIATKNDALGKDKDERVWRRPGTPSSHPWYLRSTLRSESLERQQPKSKPWKKP